MPFHLTVIVLHRLTYLRVVPANYIFSVVSSTIIQQCYTAHCFTCAQFLFFGLHICEFSKVNIPFVVLNCAVPLNCVAISHRLTYLGAVPANYIFSVASSTIYNNVIQHAVLHVVFGLHICKCSKHNIPLVV